MRIKKKTWILTFESTTQAMAAEKILFGAKLTGTSDSDSKGDYGRLWSFLEDSTGGER